MMNHDILVYFQTNPNVEPREVTDERGDRTQAQGESCMKKGDFTNINGFLVSKLVDAAIATNGNHAWLETLQFLGVNGDESHC